MNSPFFSIVVPTLNEEFFLPKLLNDLAKQKEKNFEVIVADSHSEDKTKEAALSFRKNFSINFFANKRKNVSYQRNFGASQAKGKYLIFLDADSQVTISFTKKLEKTILKKNGLFFLPSLKTDEDSAEIKFMTDILNFFIEISQNINRPFAFGGAMILERNYFLTIGGFDETVTIAEDYDLAQRSLKWGVRAKFLPEVAVTYSLRRIRKEGKLQAYYKYMLSTTQYLLKGKIDSNLIKYEMGGHLYREMKRSKQPSNNYLGDILRKAKKTFIKLLKE